MWLTNIVLMLAPFYFIVVNFSMCVSIKIDRNVGTCWRQRVYQIVYLSNALYRDRSEKIILQQIRKGLIVRGTGMTCIEVRHFVCLLLLSDVDLFFLF